MGWQIAGPGDRFEVVRGEEEVSARIAGFIARAEERIDVCSGRNGIGIILQMSKLKPLQDAPRKGLKLRYVTEITKENESFARMMSNLAELNLEGLAEIEVRHLDGVAGNFALSDSGEFVSVAAMEGDGPLTEVIYSDASSLTSEHRYLFDTLWEKAVPAESRIAELKELDPPMITKLLKGQEQVISEMAAMLDPFAELTVCMTTGGLGKVLDAVGESLALLSSVGGRERLGRIRWLTYVGEDDAAIVNAFLSMGVEVRHTSKLPPLSFFCGRSQILASIESPTEKAVFKNVLSSNDTAYVDHLHTLFEEMWKDGVDATKRIEEIETGTEHSTIKVIENPEESLRVAWDLIQNSSEVLVMFSTPRAFLRQVRAGAFGDLKTIIAEKKTAVKILIPFDSDAVPMLEAVRKEVPEVDFRVMNESLTTKISILVADRKRTLVLETMNDDKEEVREAVGTSTYTESGPLAASYAAIFESIWKQTDLYDKLKVHEKLQSDFVNVAAHELRTPVQAIINYAELASSHSKNKDEYYRKLLRNVTRLQRLTEEILDAARIEGGTLRLNKESFSIDAMVALAVEEQRIACNSKGLNLIFIPSGRLEVEADRGRLSQVVSNLLGNAAKFTEEGSITVSIQPLHKENMVRITVADTGTGIDPEILPKLFARFVGNSQSGTGLGLYISKNIVEEHGGRIWIDRNVPGAGATFAFEVPIRQVVAKVAPGAGRH